MGAVCVEQRTSPARTRSFDGVGDGDDDEIAVHEVSFGGTRASGAEMRSPLHFGHRVTSTPVRRKSSSRQLSMGSAAAGTAGGVGDVGDVGGGERASSSFSALTSLVLTLPRGE